MSDRPCLGIWNPLSLLAGTLAGLILVTCLDWSGWPAVGVFLAVVFLTAAIRFACTLRRPGRGISRLRGCLSRVKED